MITTNYKPEKISIGGLQNKKSRTWNRYQNIPILYDERKAIVHLCGRFMVIPDYAPAGSASVVAPPGKRAKEEVAIMGDNFGIKDTYSIAIEVDAYNRKFFLKILKMYWDIILKIIPVNLGLKAPQII